MTKTVMKTNDTTTKHTPELIRIVRVLAQWLDAGSEGIHFGTLMPDGDDAEETLADAVRAAMAKTTGRPQ